MLALTAPTSGLAGRHAARRHTAYTARHHTRICSSEVSTSQTSTSEASEIPPGCSRYTVQLKKPLGLVLEQNNTGNIYVVSITPDGSADKTGLVTVGDQLIATSGVVYNKESDYGEVSVKMGQQVVRMTVQGEPFKAVSAAIGSHPGHIPVTLEFQKCQ